MASAGHVPPPRRWRPGGRTAMFSSSDPTAKCRPRSRTLPKASLSDPMFVTEIENQVMQERFTGREAAKLVFEKYDRIFQLVESEAMRRRASDLRDVATRLLRNLADGGQKAEARPAPAGPYV